MFIIKGYSDKGIARYSSVRWSVRRTTIHVMQGKFVRNDGVAVLANLLMA